ncbi:ATP-binding cassette domain-containing protein [Lachnotalea glycerini]|jgi:ABC-2 type transport system ATP-binding protein|uniref:ATP-binding cassette domain-containing protein n=1 Tax=Lachnotalea glycerini TaxID=1763509 RepID=A0A371J6U1_9FIRM|nr:ATP-binding cassette domain-containing protein [Lachnotalea glycerini]RDY28464.1 ATP-binding cassette domain-containing protein [Lachnotalea glycerini]
MIKILNLNHEFEEKIVFKNTDLIIDDGEIIWIQGENGSGKTTLFRILTGLLMPQSNSLEQLKVFLNDEPIELSELKFEINYIPSKPYLFEYLSGNDNVEYLISLFDLSDKKEQIYDNLRKLNMEADLNMEIHAYSLGMKAKLYFGIVIERETSLIIIDELLNNIDAESLSVVYRIIHNKISEENRSLLFTSHTKLIENNETIKKIYIMDKRLVFK